MTHDELITYRNSLGSALFGIRSRLNLSQKDASSKIGIDAGNLCRIENGKYSIGFDVLLKILDAYGVKLVLRECHEDIFHDIVINISLFDLL